MTKQKPLLPPDIIDFSAHCRNRDRVAADFAQYNYLKQAVAERVMEKLDIIRRDFASVLDVGCHTGDLTAMLMASDKVASVKGFDPSREMASIAKARTGAEIVQGNYTELPFAQEKFDGIFSAFALHWANDLPGVLVQLSARLKPDGVLILALAGGATLSALRAVLATAESEVMGGLSPRVLPMGDIKDMGALLGRAGLALPVADSDTLTVTYPNIFKLLSELKAMGEANALAGRLRHPTSREVFLRAAVLYEERYGEVNGRLPADFEIITLTGWKPDKNQPQPLKRGSAAMSLKEALSG